MVRKIVCTPSVADPGCLSPIIGSEFFPSRSRIRIKEFKYFNPKKGFLNSRKYDPGLSSRILILIFYPSRIQGSKRHLIPDPVTGSAIPQPDKVWVREDPEKNKALTC
jgi:hypothetical protein